MGTRITYLGELVVVLALFNVNIQVASSHALLLLARHGSLICP